MSNSGDPLLLASLNNLFGHPALRAGQAAVITNVLAGIDTLAIMPTGSGKSLTYQLPAMLLPGVTVVVSPLIALMKDQVESLPPAVRARTALINSTLSWEEMVDRLSDVRQGHLKLLYVAPERLRDRRFLQTLVQSSVSLFVVDEAHCISLWGQDFRPDYLFIPRVLSELQQPPVLAVTATATPAMATQISTALRREFQTVRLSLFRPNLTYSVRNLETRDAKVRAMIEICREAEGSGIVYVGSRKDAEQLAAILRDQGVNALHYHAGMEASLRSTHQERFMRGQARVVVATIAFGMGVDKANVRFIVHFNPPMSLEAYAQESGRAGRDGNPADCVLLTTDSDRTRLKRLANRDLLSIESLRDVYRSLRSQSPGNWKLLDRQQMVELAGGDENLNTNVALGLLEQAGLLVRHPDAARSLSLSFGGQTANGDPAWQSFLQWIGPKDQGTITIDVAAACRALDTNPADLDRLMASQPDLAITSGIRVTCLELQPATSEMAGRVETILDHSVAQAERRLDQVLRYASNRTECRHVLLAAQFGERLTPCQTACDICLGTLAPLSERVVNPDKIVPTAADALIALEAVRTTPYDMGRTGLVRLLTGSAESRLRADRSASFGALKHLSMSATGRLLDRLVEQGCLHRDTEHEYKLITLTSQGTSADLTALNSQFAATGQRPNRLRSSEASRSVTNLEAPLGEDASTLYTRLVGWRLLRARELDVPAFIVANNRLLRTIALERPQTVDQLLSIDGIGLAKIEQFGREILEITHGVD